VCVPDKVAQRVVDHDPLVEGVVFEEAILPALLLAAKIVSIEAAEFVNRGVHYFILRI